MKIQYDQTDDILHIVFSEAPIVKDVSHGWNVHIGYCAEGLAEITVLEAKATGYWPIENVKDLMAIVA